MPIVHTHTHTHTHTHNTVALTTTTSCVCVLMYGWQDVVSFNFGIHDCWAAQYVGPRHRARAPTRLAVALDHLELLRRAPSLAPVLPFLPFLPFLPSPHLPVRCAVYRCVPL